MTAEEKTITSRSKKAQSPVDDCFGDFGVVG
jgi:hypothetical protein